MNEEIDMIIAHSERCDSALVIFPTDDKQGVTVMCVDCNWWDTWLKSN
jgi:hypothetical protein